MKDIELIKKETKLDTIVNESIGFALSWGALGIFVLGAYYSSPDAVELAPITAAATTLSYVTGIYFAHMGAISEAKYENSKLEEIMPRTA